MMRTSCGWNALRGFLHENRPLSNPIIELANLLANHYLFIARQLLGKGLPLNNLTSFPCLPPQSEVLNGWMTGWLAAGINNFAWS